MGDTWKIMAARGLRSFAYGLLAVLLAVALSAAGLSPAAIGALVTVSLVGDFCSTYLISLWADRWGRRRTLASLALLMAATGAAFGLTRFYPVLLVAAFLGTLGTTASETAPFLPIEQAMLAQIAPADERTGLFARYNLVASFAGALGALAAGLPDLLARAGLPTGLGLRLMFGIYAGLALLVALLAARLSPAVELPSATEKQVAARWQRLLPPLPRSRSVVLRLAALFSVDALAGGLVVQSLMVLFFHLRYGVPLAPLAALFFGANTLAALSFLAAAPLARRFGLLNTMVFTHLPSNVLLALIPLMPTFPLAAALLLLRQLLSQMDVPTRQAYTMALVAPEERTSAASVTSLARSAGSSTSPVFSGLLLQGAALSLGLPFMLSGALKAAYDLTLWGIFRRVQLPETSGK
ncbi:MAG TPA: MFS transporter [Ktedonobacterales bacterium]|jgi:MFS family permease